MRPDDLREIRRRVGIVFQDPDDQLFMPTVRSDVAFGPANLGHDGPELDEPSSNLDPRARREFAEIVARLGITTLMVTHDLPYALELCPRSVVLCQGVIVADGPTAELLADAHLMAECRLELPYGFAPVAARA